MLSKKLTFVCFVVFSFVSLNLFAFMAEAKVLFELTSPQDIKSKFTLAWGESDCMTVDSTVVKDSKFSIKMDKIGCMKTTVMPYTGGKVKVTGFLKYENIVFREDYKEGVSIGMQLYPTDKSGKQLGPHDDSIYIYPGSSDWQSFSYEYLFPDSAGGFWVYILNTYGVKSGTIWIANLKIEELNPLGQFVELLSNRGFELNEGDHAAWQTLKGKDWDSIDFGSTDYNLFTYDETTTRPGSEGKRSILLTGPYTLVSPKFPYNGGNIKFSGWQKFEIAPDGRKEIPQPWIAGDGRGVPTQVQLAGFDENRNYIKHNHSDLFYGCYEPGVENKDWYKVDAEWQFSTSTKYVQLYIRVLPGAKGKFRYDDFSLLLQQEIAPPKPVDLKKASVTVDTSKGLGTFNYAIGGHLPYLDWFGTTDTEDPVTDYYAQMKKAGIEWVRMGRPFEWNIYPGDDADGNPIYDFKRMDMALDHIVVKNQLKLVFTLDGTPGALATEPMPSWGISWSVVNNLPKWQMFITDVLKRLIERYGKETVESWYFELWNEPICQPGSYLGTLDDYLAMYDYTAEAFNTIDANLKLGGSGGGWVREFIEHCAVGKNAATGKTGTRCDLLSYHIYCGLGRPYVRAIQSTIDSIRLAQDEFPKLKNVPVLNTETSFSYGVIPEQDTSYPSSFMAKAVKTFLDNDVNMNMFHAISSHPTNKNRFFPSYPTLFGLAGVPSPQYNGIAMFAKMNGSERIMAESTNDPIETLAAVDNGKGILRIITGNFVEDPAAKYQTDVSLVADWPQAQGKMVKISRYVIDETHCNAYTLWKKAGSPETGDKEFVHKLIQDSALQPMDIKIAPFNRKLLSYQQPSHSLVLVEVEMQK